MPISVYLFSSHLGSHAGETLGVVASDVNRRHNLTANSMIPWLSQSFRILFCKFPKPSVQECL
ncbi:hypothetical protein I79_009430 [Cricetulus griseus]|uniref:Uncharacterized protein n=1 Tax=Cricetulus griseus TaxID=10029 RepID=G3HFR6_CRIGR|nr:hypothetical protein I79_009430 [Cricetulus griseus]